MVSRFLLQRLINLTVIDDFLVTVLSVLLVSLLTEINLD